MATVERRPDAELLLRLRSRDRTAWEELYAEYQPRLRAFAYRLAGNVHDADDLVQETFVRAVPRLDRLDPDTTDLGAYLFATCKNLFLKQVERRRRAEPVAEVPEPLEPTPIDDDPERSTLLRSQQRDVRVANARLDPRQRLVLALRELEDRSYAEIGEIVGLRENAVAQLIFRARESLRVEVRLAQVDPDRFPEECRRYLPLLARHLDGELKEPRLGETLAHLDACERCQGALSDMREASRRYRALLLPPLGSDECKAAIDLDLEASGFWRGPRARWRLGGRLVTIATLGVAILVLGGGGAALGIALAGDEPRREAAPVLPTTIDSTRGVTLSPSEPSTPPPPPARPPAPTPVPVPATGVTTTGTETSTITSATETEPGASPPAPAAPAPAVTTSSPTPTSGTGPVPSAPADTRAPVVTVTGAPGEVSSSDRVELAFRADEAGVAFHCSVDGSAAAACASPVTLENLAAGAHRFSVLGTDPAGNSSSWVTVAWTYVPPDTTAPTVRVTAQPPATTTGTSATIAFAADESPVTFACALDGATPTVCTSPVVLTKLAAGAHRFAVSATDAAGNAGAAATVSWAVTRPLPDLVVGSFSANALTVANRGNAPAAASTLTITLVGTFAVPALQPGASATVRWSTCRVGTYAATVDRTNAVLESDETNNTASRTSTCQVP